MDWIPTPKLFDQMTSLAWFENRWHSLVFHLPKKIKYPKFLCVSSSDHHLALQLHSPRGSAPGVICLGTSTKEPLPPSFGAFDFLHVACIMLVSMAVTYWVPSSHCFTPSGHQDPPSIPLQHLAPCARPAHWPIVSTPACHVPHIPSWVPSLRGLTNRCLGLVS